MPNASCCLEPSAGSQNASILVSLWIQLPTAQHVTSSSPIGESWCRHVTSRLCMLLLRVGTSLGGLSISNSREVLSLASSIAAPHEQKTWVFVLVEPATIAQRRVCWYLQPVPDCFQRPCRVHIAVTAHARHLSSSISKSYDSFWLAAWLACVIPENFPKQGTQPWP